MLTLIILDIFTVIISAICEKGSLFVALFRSDIYRERHIEEANFLFNKLILTQKNHKMLFYG